VVRIGLLEEQGEVQARGSASDDSYFQTDRLRDTVTGESRPRAGTRQAPAVAASGWPSYDSGRSRRYRRPVVSLLPIAS
jgi:hypothetical protein